MKDDGFINPVQEFRAESAFQRGVHRFPQRPPFIATVGLEPERLAPGNLSAEVAGHYNDSVAEINDPPVAVGQPPVLQDLEQHIEYVGVRLFDFVEQHHPVGAPPHRFGELAALVVADIAGGSADQPRNRMPLHILRHIQAHHIGFVVKQKLRQRPRQFGLAHAGRPQEYETADGPARVAKAGAGAADGLGYGGHGFVLPDNPPVQFGFHIHQPLALAGQQPPGGDAGPGGHQFGDV